MLHIMLYLMLYLCSIYVLLPESVASSMGFLRGNDSLQSQVDKRLSELERITETATKGRNKSQQGGPGRFL